MITTAAWNEKASEPIKDISEAFRRIGETGAKVDTLVLSQDLYQKVLQLMKSRKLKELRHSPLGKTIIRTLGARHGKPIIMSLYTTGIEFDWKEKDPMELYWGGTPQGSGFWCNVFMLAEKKGVLN